MNENRRFGFALSSKEVKERKKEEKSRRWCEKLKNADIGKLRVEFDSLSRAKFLSSQQSERKRLVERMIASLEEIRPVQDDKGASKEIATPRCSSSECSSEEFVNPIMAGPAENLSVGNQSAKVAQLVPRQLRKKASDWEDDYCDKKRAKVEEAILLSKDTVGDSVNEFFESLGD